MTPKPAKREYVLPGKKQKKAKCTLRAPTAAAWRPQSANRPLALSVYSHADCISTTPQSSSAIMVSWPSLSYAMHDGIDIAPTRRLTTSRSLRMPSIRSVAGSSRRLLSSFASALACGHSFETGTLCIGGMLTLRTCDSDFFLNIILTVAGAQSMHFRAVLWLIAMLWCRLFPRTCAVRGAVAPICRARLTCYTAISTVRTLGTTKTEGDRRSGVGHNSSIEVETGH